MSTNKLNLRKSIVKNNNNKVNNESFVKDTLISIFSCWIQMSVGNGVSFSIGQIKDLLASGVVSKAYYDYSDSEYDLTVLFSGESNLSTYSGDENEIVGYIVANDSFTGVDIILSTWFKGTIMTLEDLVAAAPLSIGTKAPANEEDLIEQLIQLLDPQVWERVVRQLNSSSSLDGEVLIDGCEGSFLSMSDWFQSKVWCEGNEDEIDRLCLELNIRIEFHQYLHSGSAGGIKYFGFELPEVEPESVPDDYESDEIEGLNNPYRIHEEGPINDSDEVDKIGWAVWDINRRMNKKTSFSWRSEQGKDGELILYPMEMSVFHNSIDEDGWSVAEYVILHFNVEYDKVGYLIPSIGWEKFREELKKGLSNK